MYLRWFSTIIIALSLTSTSCSQQRSAEEYIQNGQAYFDKKEWKSAIIEFKNAVKQAPENSKARALLGKTYVETFNALSAIKELNRAKDLGYDEKEIVMPLGRAYLQNRGHQKIIDEVIVDDRYTSVLKANIFALRAIAYLALGDRVAARKALDRASKNDSTATDVRLAWATYEMQNGDVEAQKGWLKPLLKREGGVAAAWSQMGEIENSANNLEAADKAYTRSIEIRQAVHYDYARRALVRAGLGNYDGAQADVDSLKNAGANWPIVGHIEGVLAFQNSNLDLARGHFKNVLSKTPDYSPSQYMLALVYFNSRDFLSAATLLEKYTAANPDQVRSNLLYASTLIQLNRIDKALTVLDKVNNQQPDNYRVLSLLGNAYLRQRQPDKAIEVLRKAVALEPDQSGSRLQLGVSLLGNKATIAEGQKELISALKLNPNLLQAELALFQSYLIEKRFSDARKIASGLNQKRADSSQGANLIALTFLAEEQKNKAVNLLQETLKHFPADFLTSHNLARIHLQDSGFTEAKSLYEAVLEKESSNLQTLNQLALIAARQGDQEQMMLRLNQARERNPEQLSPKITLASQYLRQNKANQAVQVLNDVQPDQQKLPAYKLLMAQAKIAVKEHQHAIRLLKSLVAENPKIPSAHFLLAQGYSLDRKPRKIRESLLNALKLLPDHLMANIMLSRLDLFEGKFDEFKRRVNYLNQTYPENADVQFLKAKVASGDRNFDGAIDTLASLMEQTPHSDVIVDLSRNQWQTGDKKSAISGLELWTQEHGDDSRALTLLAQFYLADNRSDDAKLAYGKLAKQTKNNPVVLNNLAWLLKESNPEQGIVYASQALEIDSESAFIQDTLAMLYLETGENAKALNLSRRAANAMPDFADIQLNYVKVLVANDRRTKAKEILNGLYKKSSSEEERKRIRKEFEKL